MGFINKIKLSSSRKPLAICSETVYQAKLQQMVFRIVIYTFFKAAKHLLFFLAEWSDSIITMLKTP